MKPVILLFAGIFAMPCCSILGQDLLEVQMQRLANKKIKSTSIVKAETGGSAAGSMTNYDAPMTVSESKIEKEKTREIATDNKGQIGYKISVIKHKVETKNGVIEYSSDNPFERDPIAANFGQKYDQYVGKQVLDSNLPVGFESVWSEDLPATHHNWGFAGILLNLKPAMAQPTIGNTWTDTTRRKDEMYYYQFTVKKIQPNKTELAVTIKRTYANGTTDWEGIMWVNMSNGLINEMTLNGSSQRKKDVMGSAVTMRSKLALQITNQ